MTNKKIIVGGLVITVVGIASYMLYLKYKKPTIAIENVDWTNGIASINIDGAIVTVKKGFGIMIPKNINWSIEYNAAASPTGPANSLVIMYKGMPDSVLATKP